MAMFLSATSSPKLLSPAASRRVLKSGLCGDSSDRASNKSTERPPSLSMDLVRLCVSLMGEVTAGDEAGRDGSVWGNTWTKP